MRGTLPAFLIEELIPDEAHDAGSAALLGGAAHDQANSERGIDASLAIPSHMASETRMVAIRL